MFARKLRRSFRELDIKNQPLMFSAALLALHRTPPCRRFKDARIYNEAKNRKIENLKKA